MWTLQGVCTAVRDAFVRLGYSAEAESTGYNVWTLVLGANEFEFQRRYGRRSAILLVDGIHIARPSAINAIERICQLVIQRIGARHTERRAEAIRTRRRNFATVLTEVLKQTRFSVHPIDGGTYLLNAYLKEADVAKAALAIAAILSSAATRTSILIAAQHFREGEAELQLLDSIEESGDDELLQAIQKLLQGGNSDRATERSESDRRS